MLGYYTVEAQIYYPKYIYMVECIANITGTNYCPATKYVIMYDVRCLLTIMFTQSSCIDRLQVEKGVSPFVQA